MTNKTDKNSNAIRTGTQLHPEQSSTDTNPKKFEVILYFSQHCCGSTVIEAKSLKEAEEKAVNIQADEIEWEPFYEEIIIDSVEDI